MFLANSLYMINNFLTREFVEKEETYMWIYSPYITRKGRRIYASNYGLKVFKFWVDDDKVRK